MTRESVEIILKLWTKEPPFEYHGDYWHVVAVSPDPRSGLGVYVRLYQQPHPPSPGRHQRRLRHLAERRRARLDPMSSSQMPIEGLMSH